MTRRAATRESPGCHWRRVCQCALGAFVILVCGSGCSLPKNTWFAQNDAAQKLATQARHAQECGDCAQAEHLLTAAVKTNPRDTETRLELSDLLMEQGSRDDAVLHLRKLAEQNPEDPRPVTRLAEAMYTRGDLSEATSLVDRALRLDPSSVDALLLRGRLHEHRHQEDAALAAYCRAYQSDRSRLEPQLRMAEVHLRRKQARQSGAILRNVLNRTDLAVADQARSHWLLGQSYAQEKRWNEAADALRRSAEHRRMTADDWYQLAFAAYRAGDFTLSRQSAAAALQIDPQHASATAIHDLLLQQTASR